MNKKEEKVEFDLSVLGLTDLIQTYQDINDFISFLDKSKIEVEKKEDKKNA